MREREYTGKWQRRESVGGRETGVTNVRVKERTLGKQHAREIWVGGCVVTTVRKMQREAV